MTQILTHFTALLLSLYWYGWVIATLWTWFMVPLGAPVIGIAHAIGLRTVGKMLVGSHARGEDDRSLLEMVKNGAMGPLAFLTIGYTAHFWMP